MNQATSSLKKLLCRCNTLKVYSSDVTEIPFDEAKNPVSLIYSDICDQSQTSSFMPTSLRHKLIEAHCLQERCVEEVDLLNQEISRLNDFYEDQIGILGELCNSLQDGGIRSLLERKKLVMLNTFLHLKATLSGTPVEAHKTYEVLGDGSFVFPSSSISLSKLDDDKLYVMAHEQEFSSDEEESDEDGSDDIAQ